MKRKTSIKPNNNPKNNQNPTTIKSDLKILPSKLKLKGDPIKLKFDFYYTRGTSQVAKQSHEFESSLCLSSLNNRMARLDK